MEIQGISGSPAAMTPPQTGAASWLPPGTSWEKILEQERTLAMQNTSQPKPQFRASPLALRTDAQIDLRVANYRTYDSTVRSAPQLAPREAHQIKDNPSVVFSAPQITSTKSPPIIREQAAPLSSVATPPTQAISSSSTIKASDTITLEQLAERKGLFDRAWVQFDSARQTWQAKWSKPPMLHFGMLLKPALLQELQGGHDMVFISEGRPAKLSKGAEGELKIIRDGEETPLNAGGINRLLSNGGISSDSMKLFVDDRGDLVLEANGPAGEKLAKSRS